MLAPLGRLGSRVPGAAMQRSGLSTAAAATSVPRAMTGRMTGRMAGAGAISAGQMLAGARRYATTEASQEGAYANLRQRTGAFSLLPSMQSAASRGCVPRRAELGANEAGGRLELGVLGRLRTNCVPGAEHLFAAAAVRGRAPRAPPPKKIARLTLLPSLTPLSVLARCAIRILYLHHLVENP